MSKPIKNSIPDDIPPHHSAEMISMLKKLSIDERAEKFFALWNFAREMQWTGMKMRNSSMTDSEVTLEFKKTMHELYSKKAHAQ